MARVDQQWLEFQSLRRAPGYRTLLSLKEAVRPQEVALLVHSPAQVHPVLPAARGTDVRVPYWLSPEHLERGGSVHKNKLARIINDPSGQ